VDDGRPTTRSLCVPVNHEDGTVGKRAGIRDIMTKSLPGDEALDGMKVDREGILRHCARRRGIYSAAGSLMGGGKHPARGPSTTHALGRRTGTPDLVPRRQRRLYRITVSSRASPMSTLTIGRDALHGMPAQSASGG